MVLQCSVIGITLLSFLPCSAPGGRASALLSVTFCCCCCCHPQGDSTADGNIWRVTVSRNWTSLSSSRLMLTCLPTSTKKKGIYQQSLDQLYSDKERQRPCPASPSLFRLVLLLTQSMKSSEMPPAPADSTPPSTKQPDQCLARSGEVPPCTT